jgi:hypothetical protein
MKVPMKVSLIVCRRDAAVERTGMYLPRISDNFVGAKMIGFT